MFTSKVISALAVLGVAAAQTASICSTSGTATINSQADATQYASCSTFSGSILIGPNAAGDISIDGPEQIKGDVICENNGALNTLSSTTVGTITGSFTLKNVTRLSNLGWSSLTTVKGIAWDTLPLISSLAFTQEVTKADTVVISNTFLNTLEGINLESVETIDINNNNRLTTFESQIANVTQSLNIDSNGKLLDLSLPNLVWASSITLRTLNTLSIPSLSSVNNTFGMYGNFFESVSAPNLTTVGTFKSGAGALAFVGNTKLTNITMPLLNTVGGANQIANNTLLRNISFPELAKVGGAIDYSGNFTTPELPALKNVQGGFNMQSEQAIDCSFYDALSPTNSNQHGNNAIQGVYTCIQTDDAKAGVGSATGTGSSGSSATSTGAAVSYGVNEAIAGLSVVGGFLQMLL